MSALLELRAVTRRFRGLVAVDHVSFAVPEGAIVALIGPNGAGKTTTFNLIAGAFRPDAGRIVFAGRDIAGASPHRICGAGIARTFQLVRPFGNLSVLENVMVGAFRITASRAAAERKSRDVLERLGLDAKGDTLALSLTLPERKRLEVARALATEPRLLLLDEVMSGLRPVEIDGMVRVFAELARDLGVTILLTEHVMRAVMALASHIVVLHHGQKICEGPPQAVARDQRVIECYLGKGAP
ncbi:MAG: ABC transporter ATP-binding protein [Stellaceae bacterium]